LLSPEAAAVFRRATVDRAAAIEPLERAIRTWMAPGGTLCVFDLEPTLGVQLAARLSDVAHPVIVLPTWPYAEGVLPTAALLRTLLDEARTLPEQGEHANAVFVLDARRNRQTERPPKDPRADNRYTVASADLPNLRTLRERGIRRIHHLRHG
jgi:hypothetical protein